METNINGLYVGQLTDEEMEWFEAEIKAGRARRSYAGAEGILGVSKVEIINSQETPR